MFGWSIALFIIAIVAAVFGFSGIAGGAAAAAQITFFIALALGIITFCTGRRVGS